VATGLRPGDALAPAPPPLDREGATTPLLRRGLLWLGALTCAGTALELAVERHWTQPIMLLAWAAVATAAVSLGLVGLRPTAGRIRLARALAALVVLTAMVGVGEHVYTNFDAGSLDQHFARTWDSLSLPTRLWLAVSKTVGPSPPLAPGALIQGAVCALLASARHPVAARAD
jgi:hypothetical protein